MTVIDPLEERDRDWDWFAVDPEGKIGHFTTAGIRELPKTVKQDKEAALKLIHYFFETAHKAVGYTVRPEVQNDAGGWKDESARNRYLKDFVTMASAGIFSYDTYTSGPNEAYFLVATPAAPLHIDQIPPDIRELVRRTRSPFIFMNSEYIAATDTNNW
jgi:hypothetical protein